VIKGVFMKKNVLRISGIIIMALIGFFYYINTKQIHLKLEQNIEKISIRDGNNGKIVEITRNEDINIILYQINSLNLEKKYKRADYTGWEIILDIYYKNKERPESIVIRHNGIEYNNYFYGENNETEKLLSKLKKIANGN
jgi:hypothetical protein